MPNSIKELIQQMNGESVTVVQGVVTSAKPLRIALVNDAMINLPSDLLIVPEYLTKRIKTVTVTMIDTVNTTEENVTVQEGGPTATRSGGPTMTNNGGGGNTQEGGGTEYTGYDYDNWALTDMTDNHNHTIPRHRHPMGNHVHSLNEHNHTIDEHFHALNKHSHATNTHKHSLSVTKKTAEIEIDDSLKVNEVVHMLSIGKGKIYYVLGRA